MKKDRGKTIKFVRDFIIPKTKRELYEKITLVKASKKIIIIQNFLECVRLVFTVLLAKSIRVRVRTVTVVNRCVSVT